MPKAQKSSVQIYRQRMKRKGLVRVEVQARKDDVALVRGVAAAPLEDVDLERSRDPGRDVAF